MYIQDIAYHLNRRDEIPNQELGRRLAELESLEGISEIASYLEDKNKSIASDCLKVLYEIGYIKPQLIVPYTQQFIKMLNSKNNRMVWGSMIALASIAKVNPQPIFDIKEMIFHKINTGTVITNVWGVYTLIHLAGNGYYDALIGKLFELQKSCRPVDFPNRGISIYEVLEEKDYGSFNAILESRMHELSASGQKKLKKIMEL